MIYEYGMDPWNVSSKELEIRRRVCLYERESEIGGGEKKGVSF